MRKIQNRQVNDRHTPLAAQLTRPNGDVIDLTEYTVKFAMYDASGVAKVTEADAQVISAAQGRVRYKFNDADVDTPGHYNAYFIIIDNQGFRDTFPVLNGHMRVDIQEP